MFDTRLTLRRFNIESKQKDKSFAARTELASVAALILLHKDASTCKNFLEKLKQYRDEIISEIQTKLFYCIDILAPTKLFQRNNEQSEAFYIAIMYFNLIETMGWSDLPRFKYLENLYIQKMSNNNYRHLIPIANIIKSYHQYEQNTFAYKLNLFPLEE